MMVDDLHERFVLDDSDTGLVGVLLCHEQKLKWIDRSEKISIYYQLNRKLFQINEPYFMKTERDSLIQMKINPEINNEILEPGPKKLTNRGKKRKKSVTKKISHLENNLTLEEKQVAQKLVEKVLRNGSMTGLIKPIDQHSLLNHIDVKEGESNKAAQSFVNSLFCNRFESLNYRSKMFCNPYNKVEKIKFGLSNYLIPARCSFAGVDIIEGIQTVTKYLKIASVKSEIPMLVCTKNPFFLVMDPAWDNNKSVKRKRSYETVSLDYLRRMCRELRTLIDLVYSIKSQSLSQSHLPILSAIWTTKADKDFVVNEMLPALGLDVTYEFKWHKITKSGLPVKVHGGSEYLIIAQKSSLSESKAQCRKGVLLSIPSAIHSHKPSVMGLFQQLFGVTFPYARSRNVDKTELNSTNDEDFHNEYNIVQNEIIVPLCGLELFARYLHTGFHSIGFECIKLQNELLFEVH